MAGYPLHISMSNLRFTTMAFALLLVVLAAPAAGATDGCASYLKASTKTYSNKFGNRYWVVTKTAVAYCWWQPYYSPVSPASLCVVVGSRKSCRNINTNDGRVIVSQYAGRQYFYRSGLTKVCAKYTALGWTPEGPVRVWGDGPSARHQKSRCTWRSLK